MVYSMYSYFFKDYFKLYLFLCFVWWLKKNKIILKHVKEILVFFSFLGVLNIVETEFCSKIKLKFWLSVVFIFIY